MDDKIIFSEHALYQIKERGLLKSEILLTISKPDKIISQYPDKFQAVRTINKGNRSYLLIVIYLELGSYKKVITAFLTSKIDKYL